MFVAECHREGRLDIRKLIAIFRRCDRRGRVLIVGGIHDHTLVVLVPTHGPTFVLAQERAVQALLVTIAIVLRRHVRRHVHAHT